MLHTLLICINTARSHGVTWCHIVSHDITWCHVICRSMGIILWHTWAYTTICCCSCVWKVCQHNVDKPNWYIGTLTRWLEFLEWDFDQSAVAQAIVCYHTTVWVHPWLPRKGPPGATHLDLINSSHSNDYNNLVLFRVGSGQWIQPWGYQSPHVCAYLTATTIWMQGRSYINSLLMVFVTLLALTEVTCEGL